MSNKVYKLIYGDLLQLKTQSKKLENISNRQKKTNEVILQESYQSQENWEKLTDAINSCTLCELSQNRQNKYIEFGQKGAKWFFIGDNLNEETYNLFKRMINKFNLNFDKDIYFTSAVKCPEFSNIRVTNKQLDTCKNYLYNQISLSNPKIIVIMGYHLSSIFYNNKNQINTEEILVNYYNNIPIFITFDLEFLIRNEQERKTTWKVLQQAKEHINDKLN